MDEKVGGGGGDYNSGRVGLQVKADGRRWPRGGGVEPNNKFGSMLWGDYKAHWQVTYVPVFSPEARPLTLRSTDMKTCSRVVDVRVDG